MYRENVSERKESRDPADHAQIFIRGRSCGEDPRNTVIFPEGKAIGKSIG